MNHSPIITPFWRRNIGECFYLVVDLERCENEIKAALNDAKKVEQAVAGLLNGSITPDEFLEIAEEPITTQSMDVYLDEIADNCEQLLKPYGVY